jgi:hypothetical protein
MTRELKDMLRDMKRGWDDEIADLKGVVDDIERDYENAKAVARAMVERDPEVRLH